MNDKGFTLTELIATIVLIGIISVISFVSMNAVIENNKVRNWESLVNNIENATKEYVSDNRYNLTGNNNLIIDSSVLLDNNYLSNVIVDPFTDEVIIPSSINIYIDLNEDYMVDSITVRNGDGNIIDCGSGKW